VDTVNDGLEVDKVTMVESAGQPRSDPAMPQSMDYLQIADDIASRILMGEYPADSKLPSYREFALLYSVHISTVQRAISLLRDRRLVYGQAGRGVFVRGQDT
jgi:GntR family transcriptional regulator